MRRLILSERDLRALVSRAAHGASLFRVGEQSLSEGYVDTGGLKVDGLWVLTDRSNDGNRVAVVLDVEESAALALRLVSKPPSSGMLAKILRERVILGLIMVGPVGNGECWGAWEVKMVSSPRHAGVTYALGYAMSPRGILVSDRNSVSDKAKESWGRVYNDYEDQTKNAREKKSSSEDYGEKNVRFKLDNIALPAEERETPDFEGDDCQYYSQAESDIALTYAAKMNRPRAQGALGSLRANEAELKSRLERESKGAFEALVSVITPFLQQYFDESL